MNPKIIVICGPTATGKTNLALSLGKKFPKTSLISLDSRQAYQELDILTGKDIPKDFHQKITRKVKFQNKSTIYYQKGKVRIWGVNLIKPNQEQNLSDFVKYSWAAIKKENYEKRQIILVGGTGLYLKGVIENLDQIHIPKNDLLRQKLYQFSTKDLKRKLKKINPKKYLSLNHSDQNNPRRLIRQIEISLLNNQYKPSTDNSIKPKFMIIGLQSDLNDIEDSIRNRVKSRLKSGVLTEVKSLLKKYPDQNLHIYSALGIKEIIDYLNNKLDQRKLIEKWSQSEIAYAKRQITWFKKQTNIIWYDKNIKPNVIIKKVNTWLKN